MNAPLTNFVLERQSSTTFTLKDFGNKQSHEIAITPIGYVPLDSGKDQHILVTCDTITEATLREAFLYLSYRDTNTPGGYFCHDVTVIPHKVQGSYIVIVHHRFNT